MIAKFFGSKGTSTENATSHSQPEPQPHPHEEHTMPNGSIGNEPVKYSFGHQFDGDVLKLAVGAGEGHTGVVAYPSDHEPAAVPMKRDGDFWVTDLHGFEPGQEVEVHFSIHKDGEQADNSTAKHKITLKADSEAQGKAGGPKKHRMPHGCINDQVLEYSFQHAYEDGKLLLRLEAGPGHSSVIAYPTPHEPAAVHMTQDGDAWVAALEGFHPGDEVEVHFVVQNSGQECNNAASRHKVTVPQK
eukprot:EG_transcript_16928